MEDWNVVDPVLEENFAKTTFRTPVGPSSTHDTEVIFMFEDNDEVWNQVSHPAFVITLFPLDSEKMKTIEASGSWWFDLANSTWGGERTRVSLAINGWLSRYGHWMKYTS